MSLLGGKPNPLAPGARLDWPHAGPGRRRPRRDAVLVSSHDDELRPVTALFADVVGSTALAERLSPDEAKALIGECVSR